MNPEQKLPPRELWDKWVEIAKSTFTCCDDGCHLCHLDQAMYMQQQLKDYQNDNRHTTNGCH